MTAISLLSQPDTPTSELSKIALLQYNLHLVKHWTILRILCQQTEDRSLLLFTSLHHDHRIWHQHSRYVRFGRQYQNDLLRPYICVYIRPDQSSKIHSR
jgi:hypothetical protein